MKKWFYRLCKADADTAFQRGQSNWLGSKVSPYSCVGIRIYLRYHLCCVINFNTLVECPSVQDQLRTGSQWKGSILTNSQFCKTSKNLQLDKQGLFSLIPETAVQRNFPVSLARFFRTTILYYIDNHMQNRCSKWYHKIHGKTL